MSLKILIVEDEMRISHLLKMYFKREAFHVDVTDNGNDGLDLAIKEEYAAIILDVFLPGIDGFTILAELRKKKTTPVLLLSAQSADSDLKRGRELGANAFISKPFSPSDVVSKVKELLL